MIDLHMHTLWSDGVLVPAELCQRARHKGVRAMAITDHVDHSNIGPVVTALVKFCRSMEKESGIIVLPGFEITHVPPGSIAGLAAAGRRLGAKWVVVHGETPVEPVPAGTNHAAILAGVDLLAHPGIISEEDVKLAAKKGVALEISARKGHSLGNGRVASLGLRHGAVLVLNTDAHAPEDLIDAAFARVVALGAGLAGRDFSAMLAASEALVKKAMKRRAKK
jgi:putative hydrolase